MSAPASIAHVVRFDTYELDLHAGELRKRGVKLRLQGQPLQVLGILVQESGKLVTREELRRHLWSAETFVDFDHSLHNAIARIREALGDSPESPRYIETLPRRGYRFIAPVEEVKEDAAAERGGKDSDPSPESELNKPGQRFNVRWLVTFVACLAVGVAGWTAWSTFRKKPTPTIRSIAVLPLQDLSTQVGEAYFADAMTEELITELSHIQALRVISHTSVREYKATNKHLPQIARELGVDDVVEGSVTHDGDQVRVTVQLLDAPNDRHLWSEDYQRPMRGILDLQREVAQAIAQQVRVKLSPPTESRTGMGRKVNPEAYEAYLRGRYYLTNRFSTAKPLNTAKSYFETSIERDPNLAPAYAGLGGIYLNRAFYRHASPKEAYESAKSLFERAIQLDEGLSEAHTGLAILKWQYERNWPAAEQEFDYVIAHDPSYDCVRAHRANYLAWRGQRAQALAEVTKGRELNPGSSYAIVESGVFFQLRDYEGLVKASQRGIISDPDEWLEHYFLGVGYEGLGRMTEAVPEYQKAVAMSKGDQDPTAALAHAYALTGKKAEAERMLSDLRLKAKDGYVSPYLLAVIYAGLDEKDQAVALLDEAYKEHSLDIVWGLKADLRLDNLRSDARFQELLGRMQFPN
jgi:TolB-like protein/DNA-binding winged helix-turn-helix (wHTH) protein